MDRVIAVAAFVLALPASEAGANGPAGQGQFARASFDCSRAESRVEHMICDDEDLGRDDISLAEVYARLLRHSPAAAREGIRQDQRAWLKRRDACAMRDCVVRAIRDRLDVLEQQAARVDAGLRRGLSRVGQCQDTVIDDVGPRLQGPDRPDEEYGTSVGFANGVYLYSYALEPPVARSRTGDRARVCLVSIPKHCPPGDDRGREYAVTNMRTGERWRLPDSSHRCGGA